LLGETNVDEEAFEGAAGSGLSTFSFLRKKKRDAGIVSDV
jgi:hypothetical protein|tara:strand:+ start:5467 stop:5586 length:120 start_codon:yes stop_codon:yes gene_type:complete